MKKVVVVLSILFSTLLFAEQKEYIYGEAPYDDPVKLKKAIEPLVEYLAKEAGIKITFRLARDYSDLIDRMAAGTVDIAYSSTNVYIEAKKREPKIKVLATHTEMQKGSGKPMPYYYSHIVVKSDSPYKRVDDLKGKKFAFTDKESTSGYVYPSYIFKKMGINPESYFEKVFFLKKHDKVCDAVNAGSVDAGAVYDGQLESYNKSHKNTLRSIAKSEPIPLEPFTVGPNVPDDVAQKLKRAILKLDAKHPVIKNINETLEWEIEGFFESDDKFYDTAREVKKSLE